MRSRILPFFTLGVRRTGVVTKTDLLNDPYPPARTGPPQLIVDRCDLHGRCILACPTAAIRIDSGDLVVDVGRCISCRACLDACPNAALVPMQVPEEAQKCSSLLEVRYHVR